MPRIMMMDGPNAGEIITRYDVPPYLDFPIRRRIKIAPSEGETETLKLDVTRYRMAFISPDRQWALYTLTGGSDFFLGASAWIVRPKELKRPQPVYMEARS